MAPVINPKTIQARLALINNFNDRTYTGGSDRGGKATPEEFRGLITQALSLGANSAEQKELDPESKKAIAKKWLEAKGYRDEFKVSAGESGNEIKDFEGKLENLYHINLAEVQVEAREVPQLSSMAQWIEDHTIPHQVQALQQLMDKALSVQGAKAFVNEAKDVLQMTKTALIKGVVTGEEFVVARAKDMLPLMEAALEKIKPELEKVKDAALPVVKKLIGDIKAELVRAEKFAAEKAKAGLQTVKDAAVAKAKDWF